MIEQKLLVIDDDINIQRISRELAEQHGYLYRGVTGLDQLKTEYPDFVPTLVFLDLSLKEGDGVEALRYLDDVGCQCPIIIMSAMDSRVRSSTVRVGQSRGLKMEGNLAKPIEKTHLREILEKYQKHHNIYSPEAIRAGIENNEFVLHFQPKVSMKTGEVVGVESLVRWKPPDKEIILPSQFIPVAEKSNLIKPLTRTIIKLALQHYLELKEHNEDHQIAINLSPYNLDDLSLPDEIVANMKEFKIDPSRICFEITESAVMAQPKIALDILTRLRIHGFSLSIDDFGTGYSSLLELRRMPFSEIKIDRSFVIDLTVDSDAWAIVKSIIDLGKNLDLLVAAEGIETETTWNLLRRSNCDIGQGYWICRPVEVSELLKFLKSDEKMQRFKGTKI